MSLPLSTFLPKSPRSAAVKTPMAHVASGEALAVATPLLRASEVQ